jgi:hypothetical protein
VALTYQSMIVAEVNAASVHGTSGLGTYLLRFSVEFHVSGRPEADAVALHSLRLIVSVGTERHKQTFLGFASPERPYEVRTNTNGHWTAMLFDLPLTAEQFFALEELRGGSGLLFNLKLQGLARRADNQEVCEEQLVLPVEFSAWTKILSDLDLAQIVPIGIHLPIDPPAPPLKQAAEILKGAYRALVAADYEKVVSDCRQALESARTVLEAKGRVDAAMKAFSGNINEKRLMSKHERQLVVAEAVRHYTQLAHHVDATGAKQYYSRDDATFILSIVAAYVSNVGSEH